MRFQLDAREAPAGVIRELARLVREFPGESPVYLSLDTSEGPKTYALGPQFRVRPDADFLAEARSLLGSRRGALVVRRCDSAEAEPHRGDPRLLRGKPLKAPAIAVATTRIIQTARACSSDMPRRSKAGSGARAPRGSRARGARRRDAGRPRATPRGPPPTRRRTRRARASRGASARRSSTSRSVSVMSTVDMRLAPSNVRLSCRVFAGEPVSDDLFYVTDVWEVRLVR